MTLSTSQAVRETHRIALQDHITSMLETPEEWKHFQSIAKDAAERADAEKVAFRTDYHVRVEEARQVILRQHSGQFLDHPKPSWAVETPTQADQLPSADRVDLMARNRVQADHDRRINAIRTDEMDQYKAMARDLRTPEATQANERDRSQSQIKDAFNLSKDVSPHERRIRGMSGPNQS